MTAAWLVYALATGSLVSVAAWALDGLARARRWPTRWIWAASMLTTLIVVSSAALAHDDAPSTTIPLTMVASKVNDVQPVWSIGSALSSMRAIVELAVVDGVARIARALPKDTGVVAGLVWIVGALVALATLTFVHLRLRRTRRGWPSAELHGRRVRVAPTEGPAVVGVVRPEIVVPRWLLAREAEEQRLVLAHEDEHVRARDHLLLGGACIAVALMPWHPAAWWSLARLRLAIELDCDARVLRRGIHVRSYGEMLIDLAGQCSGFRVGATALADKTSHLERRLMAMKPITTRFAIVRGGGLCAAAALSLIVACEARMPTSTEIQSMDVASAERAATTSGLMEPVRGGTASEPQFYVNGVKVTAAEAHALAPNDIVTVEMQKGKVDEAALVIRIKTLLAATADGMKYRSAAPTDGASPVRTKALLAAAASDEGEGLRVSGGPVRIETGKTTFAPAPGDTSIKTTGHVFDGVILIDGVRADVATLHALDHNRIAGVEVIKGAAAAQMMSDPAAKNGIIKVTLKKNE
jgi:beta-lactamase regulating signal transducer with metallopeptidase domain